MKTKRLAAVSSAFVVALAAASCGGDRGGPTPVGVSAVRSTTSFGFCVGYCRSTLEITPERATYRLVDPRSEQPDLERTVAIGAAEWQSLQSAIDRARLDSVPAVIGCPDCADGGAESLEIAAEGWSRTVTFEYQAAVPQLQPLLDRVRSVRQRLDAELRPSR